MRPQARSRASRRAMDGRNALVAQAGLTRLARQIVFDRAWNRVDDSVWKYRPSDGTAFRATRCHDELAPPCMTRKEHSEG